MSVSVSMKNFVIKISDVRGGGGEGGLGRHSDNPGQTGEGGGAENHDFGRTSFVNAPLGKQFWENGELDKGDFFATIFATKPNEATFLRFSLASQ